MSELGCKMWVSNEMIEDMKQARELRMMYLEQMSKSAMKILRLEKDV